MKAVGPVGRQAREVDGGPAVEAEDGVGGGAGPAAGGWRLHPVKQTNKIVEKYGNMLASC